MLTKSSENTSTHEKAHDYMRNQLFREAIVALSDVVDFQATNEQLWVDLASCYQKIPQWELAQHTLEKGLKHNPESKELSLALIRLFLEQGFDNKAMVIMRSCENDLINDMPLFAEYCGLLWESEQVAALEIVLSRWSEEIKGEPFCIYYQTKTLLLQQRSEEAAIILADFYASNRRSQKLTDLFEEVFRHLFPYKFPWVYEYEPALVHRLSEVVESLPHREEANPGRLLHIIQLALVEEQYEKAMQAIDHARQIVVYCGSESFQSAVDYFADICTIMSFEIDAGINKPISVLENRANDVDSVMARFLYHWQSDMSDEWLKDVQSLIAIAEKDDSPILWCLAFLREHGQLDQALIVAKLWGSLFPHALQAATQVADILADVGQNKESVAEIQEILAREVDISGDMRITLVKIALKTCDFGLVEQITFPGDGAGKLSFTECVAYYRLLMDHGKYGECIELLRTCRGTTKAEEILLRNLLCDAYYYSKQYDAGIGILTVSVEILNHYAESSEKEEFVLQKKNEVPESLLFHATPASVYLRLAVLHREVGDHQKHMSCIEKAYDLSPDQPICQYAWLILHSKIAKDKPGFDFNNLQINTSEYSTERFGNAGYLFGELITAELIHNKLLEGKLEPTACTNLKTAKLFYELLSPSDTFLTLTSPKVEVFANRIMREVGLGGTWHSECGENSIFFALVKDDLWYQREKELSRFLPYRLEMINKYFEENPTSSVARAAYGDAMIRAYFWQTFQGELGIQADQSFRIDESFLMALFNQLDHDSLGIQNQYLWEWFQAIQSNQVIMVDRTDLEKFSDEFFAYYLVAVRKTETKISLQSLVDRVDSDNSFLLLQMAYSMMGIGANEKALAISKSFPADLPEDPILHCVLARIYEANHKLAEAISHLDIALSHCAHVTEWHEWMAGWAYEYEDFRIAVKHLEVLHHEEQDNNDVVVMLTYSYLKQKSLNKAKKLLDQLVKRDENIRDGDRGDIEALKVLYLAEKKDLETCVKYLKDNPCKSPLMRDAFLAVANLASEEQKNDLAMSYIQRAYGYQPSHHATLITLAKVLISLRHVSDARKILDQVDMSINPSACFEKIQLLEGIGNEDNYCEQLLLAYELFPQHPGIMYRFAQFLAKTDSEQRASELLGTLFAHINPTVEQLVFAGNLHLKLGNLDKAVSYMSEVIEKQPNDSQSFLSLASAYVRQRQYGAAIGVYERAIEQKPDDHQSYYQAGILLRDMKRYQEAESFLKKAVKLAPNNWEIRNQLGAVMALNFIDHHH
jgi:tetratricopeptide (TPR) repeat protein